MPYSVTCADTGSDCPGQFTAGSREELDEHLQVHVQHAHPGLELSQEQVDGLVKQT